MSTTMTAAPVLEPAAQAFAANQLVEEGHLLRLWTQDASNGETTVLGLYRADGRAELDRRLAALPLHEWMEITVTPLGPHPNDPA
jgi:muconolactone D-isomerase